MIVYRPHRGSLAEAMEETKEFNSIEEMKEYISIKWENRIRIEDIVILEERIEDERINWDGVYQVCTNKIGNEDFIEKYGTAQCIGACTYGYKPKFILNINGVK